MSNEKLPTACAYIRVSTEDQAKHGLSLPSQLKAIRTYCKLQAIDLIDVYEEPGLTGTDDNRPQFRAMMDRATSRERPYDIVIIHSLSRFARDLTLQLTSYGRLQRARVELTSITEPFGKGSNGNMMRSFVGIMNQHSSDETSKHTTRAMNANAAEGFYNGGPVAFGYRSVTAEMRGDKAKKKLEIVPDEALLVERIFDLAEHGEGKGPLGARAIAALLNHAGISLRGARFSNGNTAGILCRTTYIGYYCDAKTTELGDPIPEADWVRVPCPAIITQEQFAAVATRRAMRNPRRTPPRVTNGVTMLPARIARCGQLHCGEGLTVRSAKSGRYMYYSCSARVNRDATACDLRAIRRETLDAVVLDVVENRLLDPEHLRLLLGALLEKSDEADARRRRALTNARTRATDARTAQMNLVTLVERGGLSPHDSTILERLAANRLIEQTAATEIDSLERQLSISRKTITPQMIDQFGASLRERLRTGDPNFRRAYLDLIVDRVEVSDTLIRISGSRSALEHALIKDETIPAGAVPIFDRGWCPGKDSNLHIVTNTST